MTSASPSQDGRWYARVIAGIAAFDLIAMTQVPWGLPAGRPVLRYDAWVVLAHNPRMLVALTIVGLWALYRFARAPQRLRWGALALSVSFILQETLAHSQGVHEEPFFQPAGALLGWMLGVLGARVLAYKDKAAPEASEEWAAGIAGATAVVGASYFNAGVCKLIAAGPAWALHPVHVRAMALAHQALPPTWIDNLLLGWLGASANVGRFAASFTLVVELGGVVFALSSRFRTAAAMGLIAWHLGLLFSTGICFYGGLLLVFCFGFRGLPARIRGLVDRVGGDVDTRRRARLGLGLGGLLLAGVVIAWLGGTATTKRGMATAVVVLSFGIVGLVSFPWAELLRGAQHTWPLSSTPPPPSPAERPLRLRPVGLLVAALVAVLVGLYLLPIPTHEHHYDLVAEPAP